MIPRTDTHRAQSTWVCPDSSTSCSGMFATQADRDRYVAGLTDFDATALSENGKQFVALEFQQQVALVRKFHGRGSG